MHAGKYTFHIHAHQLSKLENWVFSEEGAEAMTEQKDPLEGQSRPKEPCVSACSPAADLRITMMVMVYYDNGKIEGDPFMSIETD